MKWRFYHLFSYPPIGGRSNCLHVSILPGRTLNTGQALRGWKGLGPRALHSPSGTPGYLAHPEVPSGILQPHFRNAASRPSQDALGTPGTPSIPHSDSSSPLSSLPPDRTSQGLLFIARTSYSLLHILAGEANGWTDE